MLYFIKTTENAERILTAMEEFRTRFISHLFQYGGPIVGIYPRGNNMIVIYNDVDFDISLVDFYDSYNRKTKITYRFVTKGFK